MQKLKFSLLVNMYAAIIFMAVTFLPLEYLVVESNHYEVSEYSWLNAMGITFVFIILIAYANKRCSGEKLSFIQGLQYLSSFMSAGWVYISFFLIFAAFFITLPVAIVLSIYGEIMNENLLTPMRYNKLIYFFYTQRARQ